MDYAAEDSAGRAIAYTVLSHGVPVFASDETRLGTIDHIVAAAQQDIFHGIVIATADGRRFCQAADVQSIREHAVHLRLDGEAARRLGAPAEGKGAFRVDESLHGGTWGAVLDRLGGHRGWRRG